MDYNTLLQKYDRLLEENESLKRENEKLRNLLSLKVDNKNNNECFTNATITQQSSSEAKIALFRSLFCGREDVFARRWHSKPPKEAAISPFAEMNGRRICVINASIGVPYVPIGS